MNSDRIDGMDLGFVRPMPPHPLSFRGRMGRRGWIVAALLFLIVSPLLIELPVVGIVFGVWTLLRYLSATTRRLHDLGHTGWIGPGVMLLWGVAAVPLLTAPGAPAPDSTSLSGLLVVGGTLLQLAFLLWLAIAKGPDGPNAYGETAH
jgi:uncharacterized membrane protein YhaH (DUF805 family)